MKKVLIIMMAVLLATLLVVSCKADVKAQEDRLSSVMIDSDVARTFSTSVASNVESINDLVWYYKAVKADKDLFATGQKSEWTRLGGDTGVGLVGKSLGYLSYGKWTFSFKAVKNEGTVLAGNDSIYECNSLSWTISTETTKLVVPLTQGAGITTAKVAFNNLKFSLGDVGYNAAAAGGKFKLEVKEGENTILTTTGTDTYSNGVTFDLTKLSTESSLEKEYNAAGQHTYKFIVWFLAPETDTWTNVTENEYSVYIPLGIAMTISGTVDALETASATEIDGKAHYYAIYGDGSWHCITCSGTDAGHLLANTDAAYITVIENLQPTTIIPLTSNKTVDVGYGSITVDGSNVTYTNNGTAQEVVIRTSSGTTLTIDAQNDTVRHYDSAGKLTIKAVGSSSYHENGSVAFAEISKGRIALEAGSEVKHIHINRKENATPQENAFDSVIISYDKTVELTDVGFSRDDVEIAAAGTLVVALQSGTEEVTQETNLDYVWLTKQGIYEQIVVSDNSEAKENTGSANVEWVNTSSKSAETKDAAQKIANNIGTTATVNEVQYNVGVNDNRDIVLTTTNEVSGNQEVAYVLETQNDGSTVVKDSNDQAVESEEITVTAIVNETVDAQPDKEATETGVSLFAGGTGTSSDPFLISEFDHWNSFYQVVYDWNQENKKPYFKLTADIDCKGKTITNYAYNASGEIEYGDDMRFVLDGNGHEIKNIETFAGYKQLFPYIWDVSVNNVTINYNLNVNRTAAMSYSSWGKNSFVNVITTGKISTSADWACAFVAYPYDTDTGRLEYINCKNYANLTTNFSSDSYVAPFGSHTMSIKSVVLENCENYGTIAGGHASAFIGMTGDNSSRYTVSGLKNYGKIIYSISGGLFTYSSHSLNESVVAETGSLIEKAPTLSLEISKDHHLIIKGASSTYDYRVSMSVPVQMYGYNVDSWSGAFPRKLTKIYSNISGDYPTQFMDVVVLEMRGTRYDYSGDNEKTYYGIFAPSDMNQAETIIKNDNDVISLVSIGDTSFYYFNESDDSGKYYHGLVTTSNGAETGAFSGNITVTLSVEALLNGDVVSSAEHQYTFSVYSASILEIGPVGGESVSEPGEDL